MKFGIEKCAAWYGNIRSTEDWSLWASGQLQYLPEEELPPLKQIPAMQRRRLSHFAKLSFHCILESLGENINDIACVFASRHGDLHKTAKLIQDVADKSDLSPTHFGLSVHNAVVGLFSIFANNKHPMTAISAGEDSLMMAIVDAYAKLKSQNLEHVLVVYTEQVVPDKYLTYVPDNEQTLSVAFVLTNDTSHSVFSLTFEKQNDDAPQDITFQPLAFLNFYFGKASNAVIQSNRYKWHIKKGV